MHRVSMDVSSGISIDYETDCKYVIIQESNNVMKTSVYFIKY